MTNDEITRMANKIWMAGEVYIGPRIDNLARFAALVASAEREAALRAALAAHIGGANEMVTTNLVSRPVEPVGKVTETSDSGLKVEFTKLLDSGTNLYTAPAKGESDGLVGAQVVYQISMKNGATSSAWIDVDEAAYNSAKVYGEYKCRCLYTAPPQRKPLTDEEIKSMWGITEYREFAIDFARAIESAHGIGDA